MFAPVFHDDDDDEHDHGGERNHGEQELVRVQADRLPVVVVIKINNVLLLLSLGVAALIHFSTLESGYLNALMWGKSSLSSGISMEQQQQREEILCDEDTMLEFAASTSSSFAQLLRTLQSVTAIGLLSFLRAVLFPTMSRHASLLEAVLGDLLFHIQCRFVIGVVACLLPLPFDLIEATVVCVSIALQLATNLQPQQQLPHQLQPFELQ